MGLFTRRRIAGESDALTAATVAPLVGKYTFKAGVRIEDTDRWTPACNEILGNDAYCGFFTDEGHRALPWSGSNAVDLEIDGIRQRALIGVVAMPGTPVLTGDGVRFAQVPGMKRLPHAGYSVCGLALSPSGDRAAVVEFTGGASGVLAVHNLATGVREVVCDLDDGVSGAESPQWSPDSRFILLSTNPPQLIDLASRTRVTLSLTESRYGTSLDWWPAYGPSTLLALTGIGGSQSLSAWDLATNSVEPLAEVQAAGPPDLEKARLLVHSPRVSPNGDEVLVGYRAGPSADYQTQYGSRDRVTMLNPRTGALTSLFEPFVAGTAVEREHGRWRWQVRHADGQPVVLADLLVERSEPCKTGANHVARTQDEQDESIWLWTL